MQEFTDNLHTTSLGSFLYGFLLPLGDVEWLVACIGLFLLAKLEMILLRNDREDALVWYTFVAEEFPRIIGQEPVLKDLALRLVGFSRGKRNLVGMEGTLDEFAVDLLGTAPTLHVE